MFWICHKSHAELESETYFSHKLRYKFVTQIILNKNEPEPYLSHKPRYKFVTETMLNTNEPKEYSHKTRYSLISLTAQKMKLSIKDFFSKFGHIYWRNP